MKAILASSAIAGLALIGTTLSIGSPDLGPKAPAGIPVGVVDPKAPSPPPPAATREIATAEYGRRLITNTAELMGPDAKDPSKRAMNSRLACTSCHLDAGTAPGQLTLTNAFSKYPRFSGRSGTDGDIKERINGCMQRSMNGHELPEDSPELIAMAEYLMELNERTEATAKSLQKASEPAAFKTPDRKADLANGRKVFDQRCAKCHGSDGLGLAASTDLSHGYAVPPLWGPDSFNDGAGMHRVLTAARFIKAKMPLGDATLSDDETYDVSAFINSQPRPELAGLDADYPDKTTKPVDSGYGPYADSFPIDQHRFGPFQPIESYYKQLKQTKK